MVGVMPTVPSLVNLDLNLLVTLDALLAEQNVTRAAARLGVSQPAVSASLAKMRRHFNDDLLTRQGNRYELTPLAVHLAGSTTTALASVRRVFDAAPQFDPSTSDREFTLLVSDYAISVLGEELSRRLASEAPGVQVRFEQNTPAAIDNAQETLRAVDGIVMPPGFLHDVPHIDLYEDTWVLMVSADNDTVGHTVSLEQLAGMPWVMTFHRPTAFTPAAQHLRMLGVDPRPSVVSESFLATPFLIAGTNRIAMLQRRLALRLTSFGVRLLEVPFDVVPLAEAFWWHPVHRSDPSHAWLRDLLERAGRSIDVNTSRK